MPHLKTHHLSLVKASEIESGDWIDIGGMLHEVTREPHMLYGYTSVTVTQPLPNPAHHRDVHLKFRPHDSVRIWNKRSPF